MIEPDEFEDLTQAVAELNGLDLETAGQVVVAVGDTQAIDPETGKVVAMLPDGRTLLILWPADEG